LIALHGEQTSQSSIGLRDHEDYTRPIGALLNARHNSSTTVNTVNSQYSQLTDVGHGPAP